METWNREAVVVESILPGKKGRVSYEGSFWNARCTQPITIEAGTLVLIVDRHRLTLLCEPVSVQTVAE